MDLSKVKKVALLGRANSGKDTTAHLISKKLCDRPDYECVLMAFADPIKAMVLTMFPWADYQCLYGSSYLRSNIIPNAFDRDKQPLTYRQALIDLGELGRAYKEDHWVTVFDCSLKERPDTFQYFPDVGSGYYIQRKLVIATDVRFPNELAYLRSEGFFVIKLLRDASPVINNSSETEQQTIKDDQFDAIIENNGTLDDLTKKIGELTI